MSAIFVIVNNDSGLHLYADAESMVEAKEIDPGLLTSTQFFDVQGRRLSPVLSDTGMLMGLRDAGDPADASAVRTRLSVVLRHLASTVDERLIKASRPVTREEALRRLPQLDGQELPACYAALEPVFGHAYGDGGPRPVDDGSWWHNFWAH